MPTPTGPTIRVRSFSGTLVIERNGQALAEIHTDNDHLERRYKTLTAAVLAVRRDCRQVGS